MQTAKLTPLERFLRLFSDIRAGEGPAGLLLLVNIFLVLAAYYLIKPVREGWLALSDIRGLSKLEIKAYSSFGQSLVLLGVVPVYGILTSRLNRRTLVTVTTVFFISNMLLFWLLQPGKLAWQLPHVEVIFYLWVGIFSVTVVAQFWAFAADLYTVEMGKRLFPLIAIGASAGASAGAWFTEKLVKASVVETYDLILLAIVPLFLALGLTWWAERLALKGIPPDEAAKADLPPASGDRRNPFEVIFSDRYLLAIAILSLLINWVNTNGENILYGAVQYALQLEYVALDIIDPALIARFVKDGTTAFYGNLYFWVNLCGLLMQALLVSRLLKYGGVLAILFMTPFVSLFSYGFMVLFPVLSVIRFMKIAENSSNYSVNNTARHVIWLPVSPSLLYKAKAAVDTIFMRIGDGLAALTVMVGIHFFSLPVKSFLVFNTMLVLVWIAVAFFVYRENRKLMASRADSLS